MASVEKKKMKVTLSAAREYGEKCDTSRRRVTPLAVDTQRASERASEYADENESVHIKRTEQFQRVEERERGSTLRPSSRGDRPRVRDVTASRG